MVRPRSPIRAGIALGAALAMAVTALELSDVFVFNSGAWILGTLMRDRRRQTAALQDRTVELARNGPG